MRPSMSRSAPSKPRWLIIAANARHNLNARWRLARGRVESDIGSTHAGWTPAQSVEYINRVYDNYVNYSKLSSQQLEDRQILEIGPGDNLGVALRLYAAGAAKVTCLDKFFSTRDVTQQAAIYRALRAQLSPKEQARYDQAIRLEDGVKINPDCVRYVWGVAAERAQDVLGSHSMDLIVSRAVLWEIYDIDAALAALDQVLRPGGRMIHKIACLDWMFRQNGYHPLEFLTVPDLMYKWIARDSGKSNRCTIDYYRRAMERMGYRAQFHITRVVGSTAEEFPPGVFSLVEGTHYSAQARELISEIRPRLLPRFQALSDEDLMVEDMFLVATKSGAAA